MRRLALLLLTSTGIANGAEWFETFLPEDVVTVAGVNVARLRQAGSGPFLMNLFMPRRFRFPKPDQFDPWVQLDEFVMCETRQGHFVLLRGSVAPHQLAALAEGQGERVTRTYKRHPVAAIVSEDSDMLWTAAVEGAVLIGPPEIVRGAIDRRMAGRVSAPPGLLAQSRHVRAEGEAWAWSSRPLPIPRIMDWTPEGVLQGYSASLQLGSTVIGRVACETGSRVKAELASAGLRAALWARPEFRDPIEERLMKDLRTGTSGTAVTFELALPAGDFEKLLASEVRF